MGRKSRFSTEEKLKHVLRCIQGEDSISHTAKTICVDAMALEQWIRNYQCLGIEGLKVTSKNNSYSALLKEMAVKEYLDGVGSLSDICRKYGIRARTQLQNWILKYNSHKELKTSGTGGGSIMTKGRKTTYDEKVEIVTYCVEHDCSYNEAARKYQVSYQQVYTWMEKYKIDGVEGL